MTGKVGAIFLYDIAAKSRRRLTPPNVSASNPRWTSDGRWIYFNGSALDGSTKPRKLETGIFRISPEGGPVELVVPGGEEFSL